VFDWLNDQGLIVEYENDYNVRLVTTSTWDEFAFFAGGHGDIVSMATYETPILEQETGVDTVTFGSYNNLRVPIFVPADSDYEEIADLTGQRVGVPGPVSSTIPWSMFAKDWSDLDFCIERPDNSDCADFDLREGDHFANIDLLLRGEIEACVCIPEAGMPYLRTGELRLLYEPTPSPWEIYADMYAEGHKGLNGNNFVADKEWYESHPNEVAFFLAVWERGIQEWQEHQAEIIETYPQHFAVEDPADVEFTIDWISQHDFVTDTVYLDEEWIENETAVYDLMKETGWMDADAEIPEFQVVPPTEPAS
jgi:ABC-type nitrate/sulfonate/bicarbonate transport system substrate-binding protein